MFRTKIAQPPSQRAQHRKFAALRKVGSVGEHQLQMLAALTRGDAAGCQPMDRRRHRHELYLADHLPLKRRVIANHRAADSELGAIVEQAFGDRPQPFDIERECHGREHPAEFSEHQRGDFAGHHDVEHKPDVAFEPRMKRACLGKQRIDPVRHSACFGKQALARLGQDRFLRPLALEQGHRQLRFQLRDPIADRRYRAPGSACSAAEAALLHNGEENAQLIESRFAKLVQIIRTSLQVLSQLS